MIRGILGQFLIKKQVKASPVKKVGWMSDVILKKARHDRPMAVQKHSVSRSGFNIGFDQVSLSVI